jgi:hypothetical protein
MTITTTTGRASTTSTVLDISTDDRAPLNLAYRYHPEGSVVGADGEIPTCIIHWNPAPPSVQCLGFFPWGPWHAGKSIDFDNRNNHHIHIDSNMTGCYTYPDPRIRAWHNANMATALPTEFLFSPYQMLPIDATETMGNF